MEGHVWAKVEALLGGVEGRPRGCVYSDREILRVVVWAVMHDRPVSWSCQPEAWPESLRPTPLPDASTISRRWRRPEMGVQARRVHEASVRQLGGASRYAAIDGRPLLVGGCSKDPEARSGRAAGGIGKGYKMHTVIDRRHAILTYLIRPLNEAEPKVARDLLPQVPPGVTRIVGDGFYDSMKLHQTAEAGRRKLYTPLRENRVGRRQQPQRLRLLRLWQRSAGRKLLKSRDEIERTFGQTSTISFGFKGLPAWARRSHRVFRWMWGKNLLHHAWLLTKTQVA